jgi:hypothetical protein
MEFCALKGRKKEEGEESEKGNENKSRSLP